MSGFDDKPFTKIYQNQIIKSQRDELLALISELLEVSTVAAKEITTVRGDFIDWTDKARGLIEKVQS